MQELRYIVWLRSAITPWIRAISNPSATYASPKTKSKNSGAGRGEGVGGLAGGGGG
jgi:uncharacterized membrane protein